MRHMPLSQPPSTCSAPRPRRLPPSLCPFSQVHVKRRGFHFQLGCCYKSLCPRSLWQGRTKGLPSGCLGDESLFQLVFWSGCHWHQPPQSHLCLFLEGVTETDSLKGSCKLQQVTSSTKGWRDGGRSAAAGTAALFRCFSDPDKWQAAGWEQSLSDPC